MVQKESRVKKTLLNARVNLIFYLLTLCLSFYSRKIFLECLGNDFVGLTGTLQNILGYLNLAELGIGTAIAFNLYKPIYDGDRKKIIDLVSIFGYYYRNVGIIVFIGGLIISAFIPLIFKHSEFDFGIIYFAFYSFLSSSLIGYFINYRQAMLTADQRNYVVTAYYQSASILKVIIQIFIAYRYHNYYAWIGIELGFGIIYSYILNWRIGKVYPWLKTSIKNGKIKSPEYPNILQSTKQIFIHKVKDFILTQSDQLFIFAFVSLKMVAFYGNYVLITQKLTVLFNTVIDSVGASVGNLIAEQNHDQILKVFWELMALRYFIAGFICISIYYLITPFIALWIGSGYILSNTILVIMLINVFIMVSRGTVDNFNSAFGHYDDVWSAWAEGGINIICTIIGGYLWGIPGILLGKTISLVPIVVVWKPYYLFSAGFHESYKSYWKNTSVYYFIFGIIVILSYYAIPHIHIDPTVSFGFWILYSIIISSVFGGIYLIAIIFLSPGGRDLAKRMPIFKLRIR